MKGAQSKVGSPLVSRFSICWYAAIASARIKIFYPQGLTPTHKETLCVG